MTERRVERVRSIQRGEAVAPPVVVATMASVTNESSRFQTSTQRGGDLMTGEAVIGAVTQPRSQG